MISCIGVGTIVGMLVAAVIFPLWAIAVVAVLGLAVMVATVVLRLRREGRPPEASPYVERERIGW